MKTTLEKFDNMVIRSKNHIIEAEIDKTKFMIITKDDKIYIGQEISKSEYLSDMKKMFKEFGKGYEINVKNYSIESMEIWDEYAEHNTL